MRDQVRAPAPHLVLVEDTCSLVYSLPVDICRPRDRSMLPLGLPRVTVVNSFCKHTRTPDMAGWVVHTVVLLHVSEDARIFVYHVIIG